MKIFVGGVKACSVHNEANLITMYVKKNNQYTTNLQEADIIIFVNTCVATNDALVYNIKCIEQILKKRPNARVIVSGCLARKLKITLPIEYQNILKQVDIIPLDEVVRYVYDILGYEIDDRMNEILSMPSYKFRYNGITIEPNTGCSNHCSFCKTNYIEYPIRSHSLESIASLMQYAIGAEEHGMPINHVHLNASNLTAYGLDIYKKRNLHELIKLVSDTPSVRFITAGALINWYDDLLQEILNNPKIKCIFISLESGSERVYGLMNRPISLDELKITIRKIRRARPDIIINTEFICGFPTETTEEFYQTIETIQELDINPLYAHPYMNSKYISSSSLEQLPYEVCLERAAIAKERLMPQRIKYLNFIGNGELLVIGVDDINSIYKVMLIDGSINFIDFPSVGYGFKVGDLIPANKGVELRPFQLIRKCSIN